MGVAAKAPSDTAFRVLPNNLTLTPAVLSIELSRSAVPTHSSPAVVSTEPALRLANPHAGGTMKPRTLTCITAITLFAALALPGELAAQHTRYKLIDIGTFGGPASYFTSPGIGPGSQVLSNRGMLAGKADTPIPDPNGPDPNSCAVPSCFDTHVFRWDKGVLTDLGALPGGNNSDVGS